jgi:hypothetical protein
VDRRHLILFICGATSLGLFGACQEHISVRGNVLIPGESVRATNKTGVIEIRYISPTERRYDWDSQSRTVRLRVREEAFRGKLGLYDPADSAGGEGSQVRLVVEESQIDFDSLEQA